MRITLRPEQEKLIAQAMQTGAYHDPYEVIDRALEVLRSQDECFMTASNCGQDRARIRAV